MLYTPQQINELLQIIDFNITLFGANFISTDILSEVDKQILKAKGINVDEIQSISYPEIAFKFGILSQALGDRNSKELKYDDFKKFLRSGQYLELSSIQKEQVSYLNQSTFNYLKKLGQNMSDDLRLTVNDLELEYKNKKLIKKELVEGVEKRRSVSEISSRLAKKTEDWNRNWGRIVETELNTAFQEGRASKILDDTGPDTRVYKDVYPGACRHCIKAYLTKGIGSQPKIFTIEQLINNGTNIGRKVAEWKPVLGSMHPFCRCTLNTVPKYAKWDEERKMFVEGERDKKIQRKSKVKIQIGDREYEV